MIPLSLGQGVGKLPGIILTRETDISLKQMVNSNNFFKHLFNFFILANIITIVIITEKHCYNANYYNTITYIMQYCCGS